MYNINQFVNLIEFIWNTARLWDFKSPGQRSSMTLLHLILFITRFDQICFSQKEYAQPQIADLFADAYWEQPITNHNK